MFITKCLSMSAISNHNEGLISLQELVSSLEIDGLVLLDYTRKVEENCLYNCYAISTPATQEELEKSIPANVVIIKLPTINSYNFF